MPTSSSLKLETGDTLNVESKEGQDSLNNGEEEKVSCQDNPQKQIKRKYSYQFQLNDGFKRQLMLLEGRLKVCSKAISRIAPDGLPYCCSCWLEKVPSWTVSSMGSSLGSSSCACDCHTFSFCSLNFFERSTRVARTRSSKKMEEQRYNDQLLTQQLSKKSSSQRLSKKKSACNQNTKSSHSLRKREVNNDIVISASKESSPMHSSQVYPTSSLLLSSDSSLILSTDTSSSSLSSHTLPSSLSSYSFQSSSPSPFFSSSLSPSSCVSASSSIPHNFFSLSKFTKISRKRMRTSFPASNILAYFHIQK